MIRFLLFTVILFQLGCKPARTVVDPKPSEPTSLAPIAKIEQEPKPDKPAGPPAFAPDSGGKILARVLPPQEPQKLAPGFRSQPKSRAGLSSLEQADVPLNPPLTASIAGTPSSAAKLRPKWLPDAFPLSEYTAEPTPPGRLELPPTMLVRTPSRDVNLPIDLPIQARHQFDRASIDDPTFEFSLERAQSEGSPLRQTMAPFVRINLPEPFENRAEIRSPHIEPPLVAPTPQIPK